MATKKWSQKVTETSDALDLKEGVFKQTDPKKIAKSLKASAEHSDRRKSDPYRSAMSMLTFYINRAGDTLDKTQHKHLEDAKDELRALYDKPPRKKSLREQYMGRTPGKNSRTGRQVQKNMREKGRLRENRRGETEFKASDDKWYPLREADMAHSPKDAVGWWNQTGRALGPKSPGVRKWMRDADNYVLDHFSLNRSAGAKLGTRYLPPLP